VSTGSFRVRSMSYTELGTITSCFSRDRPTFVRCVEPCWLTKHVRTARKSAQLSGTRGSTSPHGWCRKGQSSKFSNSVVSTWAHVPQRVTSRLRLVGSYRQKVIVYAIAIIVELPCGPSMRRVCTPSTRRTLHSSVTFGTSWRGWSRRIAAGRDEGSRVDNGAPTTSPR
jgi:hypothetical protein